MSILGTRLCRVQQRRIITVRFEAKMTIITLRYLSVSLSLGAYADNLADAVDQLLIETLGCHKKRS